MAIALRHPPLIGALISVDNAPVDATLKSSFHKYTQGMWDVESAKVTKQAQADDILKNYEEVSRDGTPRSDLATILLLRPRCVYSGLAHTAISSHKLGPRASKKPSSASDSDQNTGLES